MPADALTCRIDERRRRLFGNPAWNGIDFIEVSDDQYTLSVYFFGTAPKNLTPQNVRIDGGRRVTGIKAVAISPAPPGTDGSRPPEV